MSAKAKTASKNNPQGRGVQKTFTHGGKKITPTKYINTDGRSMLCAELESGDLVRDKDGNLMPWRAAQD